MEQGRGVRLRADRVVTGSGCFTPGEVVVHGERVVAVGGPAAGPEDAVDLGAVTLAPGFVDVHNHGGGGVSFVDDPAAAAALHRAHGTTSVVASTVTQGLTTLRQQVEVLVPWVAAGELAGIHLEGPWLSECHAGAHPVELLRDPVPDEVGALVEAGHGSVRMVTLAVERPGALESIVRLARHGVVAALGHSACTYAQARAAIDAGVTGATHLFNAMPALHHRDPGPVLALLRDERVWCELVADGVHLHPDLVAGVLESCDRAVLVTDAMAAAGCGDGEYALGDLVVEVRDGTARVAGTTTIAGSTLTLDRAVRTAIGAGVDPLVALRAATANPARYLGLAEVGELRSGAYADIVVLDAEYAVRRVMRRGHWLTGAGVRG